VTLSTSQAVLHSTRLSVMLVTTVTTIATVGGILQIASAFAPQWVPSALELMSELINNLFSHRYLGERVGWIATFGYTAATSVAALGVGGAAGLILPLLFWPFPLCRSAFWHAIEFLRAVPPLVSVPFFLCLFAGHRPLPSIAAAALYAFLSAAIYAYAGIERAESDTSAAAKLYRLGGIRRGMQLILPAMLPDYVRHLRIILSLTVGIVLVGEYFQDRGLGFALRRGQDKHSLATIGAGITLAVCLIAVLEAFLDRFLPALRFVHRLEWKYPSLRPSYAGRWAGRGATRIVLWGIGKARASWRTVATHATGAYKREAMPVGDVVMLVLTVLGTVATVCGFVIVWTQLDEQQTGQAWQVVVSAAGRPGEAGRVTALQRLARRKEQLAHSDLSRGFYEGDLAGANLEGARFDGSTLRKMHLMQVNLSQATFRRSKIIDSSFTNCDLSSASFDDSTQVINTRFSADSSSQAYTAGNQQVSFNDALLRAVQFDNLSMVATDFRGAAGADVSFNGTMLQGSIFHGAHLRARFTHIRTNQATSFASSVLDGCSFRNSELNSVDFSAASLQSCHLVNVNMSGVRFRWADMRGVRVRLDSKQEGSNWNTLIADISYANIAGMDAPKGFREWALSRGAVEEPDGERWQEIRTREQTAFGFRSPGMPTLGRTQ
jgi:ABC-type nitrate/sulfonate/bicarbonate transport system permease component/uncharacterized protein YjbI with pentapeptide repeats